MPPTSRLEANNTWAATEDLSEEDQQLKSELDMIVERLTVQLISFTYMPAEQTY